MSGHGSVRVLIAEIRERFPRPVHAEDGILANRAADELENMIAFVEQARSHVGITLILGAAIGLIAGGIFTAAVLSVGIT